MGWETLVSYFIDLSSLLLSRMTDEGSLLVHRRWVDMEIYMWRVLLEVRISLRSISRSCAE